MSVVKNRVVPLGVTAAILLGIGYWAVGVYSETYIYVRNETASDVVLILVTTDTQEWLTAPPWEPGMCATGKLRTQHVRPESIGIDPSGQGSFIIDLTHTSKTGPAYVRVDPAETLHTDEPLPQDAAGCSTYRLEREVRLPRLTGHLPDRSAVEAKGRTAQRERPKLRGRQLDHEARPLAGPLALGPGAAVHRVRERPNDRELGALGRTETGV